MSGNLWMFSDMLDDEDIEMQKHDFITLSSASSRIDSVDPATVVLKKDTRVIRSFGLEEVYEIPTLIQKSRLSKSFPEIIHASDALILFHQITCNTKRIQGFYRHLLFDVLAALTAADALKRYVILRFEFDKVLIQLIHRISSRDISSG